MSLRNARIRKNTMIKIISILLRFQLAGKTRDNSVHRVPEMSSGTVPGDNPG